MKPIILELKDAGDVIECLVKVNYNSRYDGIQVNAYILGSKEPVRFIELNGKRIDIPTRLYVSKEEIKDKNFTFKMLAWKGRLRLRIAIIQEHKEIEDLTTLLDKS